MESASLVVLVFRVFVVTLAGLAALAVLLSFVLVGEYLVALISGAVRRRKPPSELSERRHRVK